MEITTVSSKMYSIIFLYDMHTGFFAKVLDGVSNDNANNRLNTKANHIAWLTGSIVHERYQLANELGIDQKDTANELFKDHQGIRDGMKYPTLESFKNDWEVISPLLRIALINVSDERLDQSFEMPGTTMSFYELVAFMTYREANCIGQIALFRRLLGLKAMDYM